MAILLECFNVIVPKAALEDRYPGGAAEYRADCPNGTYTEDEHLTRVSFMGLPDADAFVSHLAMTGLTDRDVAVVDTANGPPSECDWLEWAREGVGSRCWLKGTPEGELCRMAVPDWDELAASLGIDPAEMPKG